MIQKWFRGGIFFSQIDLHASYGRVVPELASRDHCQKIITVLEEATSKIDLESIDQIAYTAGPGLTGALLIEKILHKDFLFY